VSALVEDQTFEDPCDPRSLAGQELYRCAFRGVKWPELRLEGAKLERCTFEDCDLTRTVLAGVSLRGVVFRRCKMLGVDFTKLADDPDVTFEHSILRYANISAVNLRGSKLDSCELQEARFFEANLIDVDFAGSDLAGATFDRCDLTGADFAHAAHVFIDPRVNNAKGCIVPLETAVMMAQAQGISVAGYADPKGSSRRKR
jgi:fluoroquinolone resistance protein